MKMLKLGAAALVLGYTSMAMGSDMPNDFWSTPTIHGYGRIHYLRDSAYQPFPDQTYKIVFGLTRGAKQPGEVNPGLDRVARTVNLYVAAGVPLKQLKFVAVASGEATALAHGRDIRDEVWLVCFVPRKQIASFNYGLRWKSSFDCGGCVQ